jgi:glutathione S-transferase
MARVLVREWDLPVEEEEQTFPPDPALFDNNPLGQVPALILPDGRTLFPTLIVLEHLWRMAGEPADAYVPDRDRQRLLTILQACDALVAALYQNWTGLRPVADNLIGYDPAERNLARLARVLDWLESDCPEPGIALNSVAIAALLLWCDARGGPAWRNRVRLADLADGLSVRPAFRATAPQPWPPGA